ncbi:pyrroline-5-carboxylate reductase [Candidatus Woesearchaeota archaeon]|nr:pyrroline-5-carboxylate reductase [Candidatus Woesearchaeota archaeon]
MVRIGFIGSGNMATALIKGILEMGICDAKGIIASDNNPAKLDKVKQLEISATNRNKEVVQHSDVIFLAVKPQDIYDVLKEIKDYIRRDNIIVSIAAGIKISKIESIIGKKKIVRVMPNTPCLVSEMAAGFAPNSEMEQQEIETIELILNASGSAYRMKESLLDAVTGLSGSGPAFVAELIKAFTEAGIENSLDRETAYALTLQTFRGTARLLSEKKMQPEELVRMVSSPGGTTIAGREILDNSDVKGVIKKAIRKAVERSRELGK